MADRWWERAGGEDVEAMRQGRFTSPTGIQDRQGPPGSGPRLPPRGPDATTAGLTRQIVNPRLEKLIQSHDFNGTDYAMTLPAGIGKTVVSAKLVVQLPQGSVGYLQGFSLYVLTPTAATSAQWTVRVNGGPVPGFDNIQNPPGIANFVYIPYNDMRIKLPNGCMVDVIITNLNGGGPWTVGADLSGWFHPDVAERRAWNLDL